MMMMMMMIGDHDDEDDVVERCKEGANINDNEPRKARQGGVNICPLLLIMMKIILILSQIVTNCLPISDKER